MPDRRPIVNPSNLQELVNTDGLIAGESAALVEQSVSPATPPSGFGVVYAKTDGKLYFKNDAGTETDLTAGSGTNPVIREYTANNTWTKPTAANFWGVMVLCIAGGGGGGSGRRGAAATNRGSGSGGSGAALSYRIIRKADLTLANYSITIGSGGAGGAARTTNDTSGSAGLDGGDTSFGSLVIARRGGGGNLGSNSGANASGVAGGSMQFCTPAYGPFSVSGGASGAGNITLNGGSGSIGLSASAGAGGGGGGGIEGSNVIRNGGNGGGIFDAGTFFSGTAGGTTAGVRNGISGDDVANNILLDINNATTAAMGRGGSGGAGGDLAGTIAGGNGGNGGRGAGGGGGGASTNGANSGAGGNGGDGLCFVVEYYGA